MRGSRHTSEEAPERSWGERALIYCLIPRDIAPELHDVLRRHFRGRPDVEVVVEQRDRERRSGIERRLNESKPSPGVERRRILAKEGRRVGDRRAPLIAIDERLPLPRRARPHAERIAFVRRVAPSSQALEDGDTSRIVTRIQAGETPLISELYMRYFDRVYDYLRVLLRDAHEAEDIAQHVFVQVLQGVERYERRSVPFRSWLFTIARNSAINALRAKGRLDVVEPEVLSARHERALAEGHEPNLAWISDPDLMLFVERLPLHQRQVLAMRYMLDMSHREVAAILGKNEEDVRKLQQRALRFLRARLAAVGCGAVPGGRLTPSRRKRPRSDLLRARRFALSP